MKKYGGLIALALAIGFGVLAVTLANNWLSARSSEANIIVKDSVPLAQIVVAGKDFSIGTPLTRETLSLAEWPKSNVPKGAFHDISEVEGRIAVTKLTAGQPVLNPELAAPNSGAGLVALITQGKRAMAVRVDEVTGVGGFVLPHTEVDIIGVEETKNKKKVAHTLLKKIKVLAIAQETYTEEGQAKVVRTVTLELEPKQAETLALATHKGAIHLVLRNPLEEEVVEKPAPKVKKVAKKPSVPVLRPRVDTVAKPSPYTVEVIRGSQNPEKISFKNIDSDERIRD